MNAAHTPGPWRLDDQSQTAHSGIEEGYHYIDAGRGFFGTADTPQGFSIAGCISLADARLIAAAPDLLVACKYIVEWFAEERKPHQFQRDTPEGESEWRAWWDGQLELCRLADETAHAAIAKATS